MSVNPARLVFSSSFRLTLLYAALFSVSTLLLFGVMYWTATKYMEDQLDAGIVAELTSLRQDAHASGPGHIAELIADRGRAPGTRGYLYLLLDSEGKRVAGNLPALAATPGWLDLPMPGTGDEEGHGLHALADRLDDGSILLVGQDIYRLDEVREVMQRTFGLGFVITLVLAIAGGILVSTGFLRRVETINRISHEIMDGDISRRIPLTGSGDDFDRLSANLNGMLDRIQTLMENLRQVTNDIAHDLRTPLAHLRQRLEKSRLGTADVAAYQAAIDDAITDTDGILETFSALLRIAQIESGIRRAGFSDVDLSAIARSVVEIYRPVAEDRHQTLIDHIADGVSVRGDRQLITQMLVNLVENALNHTPAATTIVVDVAAGGGAGPRLVVRDDGPGIPEGEHEKVFRRFYRIDSSRTNPGSGLGLSLVAAVAALHQTDVCLGDAAPGLKVELTFPWGRSVGVQTG